MNIAEKLREMSSQDFALVGMEQLAYIKPTRLAVRRAHVKRLPKKLGSAVPEANGMCANVPVKDTTAARAVLEHVAQKASRA